ncbi:MAG: hypothetical protein J5879_04210 [Clostridia bacterium]|nr:hypothetical protein [Clostridia bacterium]
MFGKKYKVDYCGQRQFYKRAKDGYRAGAAVKVYYYMIGTDTDYSFYLDGARLSPLFEGRRGYAVKFRMPDHDVKLICRSTNSMEIRPDDREETT